jgi:catechol 2,3-dioxygenase-like lactoylglutathione lyase family enzyme
VRLAFSVTVTILQLVNTWNEFIIRQFSEETMLNNLKDFQHVTVSVSDVQRSLAFYRDLLGFSSSGRLYYHNDTGLVIDFLDVGNGHLLEIFSFDAPTKPSDWLPDDLQTGLRHFGFKVKDVDATTARLKDAGVSFTLDPLDARGGVRIAFFEDPDGTLLEIIEGTLDYHEEGPAAAQVPDLEPLAGELTLDHVTLTVSDLDVSLRFYRDILGFPVVGQLFAQDERGFTITYLLAGSVVLELFSFTQRPTIARRWNPDDTVLGLRHIGFHVEDVDEAARRLKEAGVRFIYEPSDALGNVKTAFFADPDGNALELIDGECDYDE